MDIRQVERTEVEQLIAIDHDYETEKVWQLEDAARDGKAGAVFRVSRLPRPMKVAYPRNPEALERNWKTYSAVFAAEENGQLHGYVTLSQPLTEGIAWITDGVVQPLGRRKGIGSALLLHAQRWAQQEQKQQLSLALQSKNFPAIQLVQRLGFEFAGYHDHFFGNRDIALFFNKDLRT